MTIILQHTEMRSDACSHSTRLGLSDKEIKRVEQCDSKQKQLKTMVQKQKRFSQEEQSAICVTSQEDFLRLWKTALHKRSSFDAKRSHGMRKKSKDAMNLAASAADIVKSLNPLVEVVRDIGAPYGGLAMGTICFALMVAHNRAETEDRINATFLDIKDRLLGVEMYKDIYNNGTALESQLQSKIVEAYESFILFCIAASEFYMQKSIVRWCNALVGIGNLDVEANRVQKAIADVRRTCDELLDSNVNQIRQQNEDIKRQNDETQKRNEEMQTEIKHIKRQNEEIQDESKRQNEQTQRRIEKLQNENRKLLKTIQELQDNSYSQKLDKFREQLQQERYSLASHLDQLDSHRADVVWEFNDVELNKAGCSRVKSSSEFKNWSLSNYSQVLVLSGRNSAMRATHCWLAPVALDLVARMLPSSSPPPSAVLPGSRPSSWQESTITNDLCLYYFLGPHKDGREDSLADVVRFLIYRLLSENKAGFRKEDQMQDLEKDLDKYEQFLTAKNHTQRRDREGQDLLAKILVRSLNLLGNGRKVWIVLERVDRCRGEQRGVSRDADRERDRKALLSTLIRAVEETSPKEVVVKVLAVVYARDWDMKKDFADDGDGEDNPTCVVREFEEEQD